MRKFLCVLALSIVAGTGWFFWPRISSELDARFPEVMQKRAEMNQPSVPETDAVEAQTAPTPEVETSPDTSGPAAEADDPQGSEAEVAPVEEPTAAPDETPELKTSLRIAPSEQVWF